MKAYLGLVSTFKILFLSLLLIQDVRADYPPDIYAICRVGLNSGENFDAIIKICDIGEGGYRPNGFGFTVITVSSNKPFGYKGPPLLNFFSNIFSVQGYAYSKDSSASKSYFLVNQSEPRKLCSQIIDTSESNIFSMERTIKHQYRLMDYFLVYTDINAQNERPEDSSMRTILMTELKSLEFINQPQPYWIDVIHRRHLERLDFCDSSPNDCSEDFFEPLWLHNLTGREKCQIQNSFETLTY